MEGKLSYTEKRLEYETGDSFEGMSNEEIAAINLLQKKWKIELYKETTVDRRVSFSYAGGPLASFCNLLG